jgi:hypothetical protein
MQLNIANVRAKKTKITLAFAAVAAAGSAAAFSLLGGVAQATVGGPTCNVPGDYSHIQDAVNDPGCTTIKVAAGIYTENVNITHSLTLKGAKAGISVNGRTASGPNESTVTGTIADTPTITINAANVTVDGFSVTNVNHGTGIDVKTAGNNSVIRDNIVDNVGGASYASNATGVYLELGPDGVRVTDNRISHIQSTPTAQGVLVGDSTSTDPSLNARFVGNTFTDVISTRGSYGIQVNNGSKSTGFATVKILNNTIKNLNGTGWVHAIGLEGKTPNAVVRNNVISNLVSGSPDKSAIVFQDNIYFFTADINRNNLAVGTNAFGIAVDPTLVAALPSLNVNGQCNWWGASNGPGPVGPGSGSMVSAGVDFTPWLKNANLNGRCGDNNNKHHDDHDGDNDNYNRRDYNDED